MLKWPSVHWIAGDGTTGTRLFASLQDAQKWGEHARANHSGWAWVLDELTTIPGSTLFAIDGDMVGDSGELVRKTLVRFYAERCDLFMVRDWGTEALQPLKPFGQMAPPDSYGVAAVTAQVTHDCIRELVRANWFELFLWNGDDCVFGLDDERDVAFILTEEWLVELERTGVFRWMLVPEALEGHGFAFTQLPRPKLEAD